MKSVSNSMMSGATDRGRRWPRIFVLLILAGLFGIGLAMRVDATEYDIRVHEGRVIVDDADPQFIGAEIRAPQFCPYDTNWLSFEVRRQKAIHLYLYNRTELRATEVLPGQSGRSDRVSSKRSAGGEIQNCELDWRPEPSTGNSRWYVFQSNVAGSFDIWLGDAISGRTIRIPAKDEAKNERGPKWSPDGELIAYWSDATFQGDIYLLKYVKDLFGADTTKRLEPPSWLVKDPGLDYEIRWYPGKKAGYLAYTHQDPETRQSRRVEIRVCDILGPRIDTIQNVAPNTYLRSASWNPTGRGDLAFYQTDEFPGADTNIRWGVGAASVKMTNPDKGLLEMRVRRPVGRSAGEIERSVHPSYDLRFGPAWTPDGSFLALTRNWEDTLKDIRSPVWLYELRSWELQLPHRSERSFAPAYKYPRDLTISGDQVALIYSEGSSRKLLTGRLRGDDFRIPKPVAVWPLVTPERTKRYDWMFVDRPGFFAKAARWVTGPIFHPNFVLNSRGVGIAAVAAVVVYAATKSPKPNGTERWFPPGFEKR